MRYWKLACDTGGEPLIPREMAFIHKDTLEEEDEDEDDEEEETNGRCFNLVGAVSFSLLT